MKRPFAVAGFTLLLTHLACIAWGTGFTIILGILALAAPVVLVPFIKMRNSRQTLALFGCFFFVLVGCSTSYMSDAINRSQLEKYDNQTVTATFVITNKTISYNNTQIYAAKVYGLYSSKQKSTNIRLFPTEHCDLAPGDIATGELHLSAVPVPRKTALHSDHIYLQGTILHTTPTGKTHWYYQTTNKATNYMKEIYHQVGFNDASGLLTALSLGDISELSDKTKNHFTNAGMFHLVAVSGLHVNLVGGILVTILFYIKTPKPWMCLGSILLVWCFALLTGGNYPSLRAALMFTICSCATLFHRRPDSLNILGAAITFILLFHPPAAGNIGFLSSVSACLGLILLFKPIHQLIIGCLPGFLAKQKAVDFIATGCATTISVTIATIPCTMLAFRSFSCLAPLANLLAVPLAAVILALSLVTCVVSLFPASQLVVAQLITLTKKLADILLWVARLFGSSTQFQIQQTSVIFLGVFIVVALTGLALYLYKDSIPHSGKRWLSLALAAVLLLGSFIPPFVPGEYEIACLEYGNASAFVIQTSRQTLVIGTGNSYQINQYIRSRGIINIDLWAIPSPVHSTDCVAQVSQLLPIKQIITSPSIANSGIIPPNIANTITTRTSYSADDISLAANQTFTQIEVTFGQNKLLYTQEEPQSTKDYQYILYPAKDKTPAQLIDLTGAKPLTYAADRTIALHHSPISHRAYTPKFWF